MALWHVRRVRRVLARWPRRLPSVRAVLGARGWFRLAAVRVERPRAAAAYRCVAVSRTAEWRAALGAALSHRGLHAPVGWPGSTTARFTLSLAPEAVRSPRCTGSAPRAAVLAQPSAGAQCSSGASCSHVGRLRG